MKGTLYAQERTQEILKARAKAHTYRLCMFNVFCQMVVQIS